MDFTILRVEHPIEKRRVKTMEKMVGDGMKVPSLASIKIVTGLSSVRKERTALFEILTAPAFIALF